MNKEEQEVEPTIAELLDGYRARQRSVVDVVGKALARIKRMDREGPTLNAMIEVDDRVLDQAAALERNHPTGKELPALYGVPVVIKDNINVAGLATTGGSAALRELRPTQDATVVARLRSAGAMILGKSSMSEFAWGTYDTENSIIFGYTRNPYHLDYASGGSSGGTGVAVAAGYCVAGLGTDTGCSVRAPSSINCLVGLRPTHNLIDMAGIMPMNADWDTVGPMARTVDDLARVLDVIDGETDTSYSQVLKDISPPPARIGIVRRLSDPSDCDLGIIGLLDAAVVDFETAGVTVADPVDSDVFTLPFDSSQWYLRFRFDIDEFLAQMGECSTLHSLEEILDSGLVLPRYTDALRVSWQWPHRPEEHPRLKEMNVIRDQYRDAFLVVMRQYSLDALVFPTFRFPPVLNGSMIGERVGSEAPIGSNNYYASLTGFPALNVPMGFVKPGLPIGLQLLGPPGSEARLMQVARDYERGSQHRRAPF